MTKLPRKRPRLQASDNCHHVKRPKYDRTSKSGAKDSIVAEAMNFEIIANQDNVLSYIGGWLIRDITCPNCRALFLQETPHPFIQLKRFNYAKADSLVSPSADFIRHLQIWESIFKKNVTKHAAKPDIFVLLKNQMSLSPLVTSCCTHSTFPNAILDKFINFRLHAYCRFFNRQRKKPSTLQKCRRLNLH